MHHHVQLSTPSNEDLKSSGRVIKQTNGAVNQMTLEHARIQMFAHYSRYLFPPDWLPFQTILCSLPLYLL